MEKENYFKRYMRDRGLSQTAFAAPLGWDRSRISTYVSGRHEPTLPTLHQIKQVYPDFDYFGENSTLPATGDPDMVEEKSVPYYDIEATAGDIGLFRDNLEKPSEHIRIPAFNDCDFAVPVYGHSMKPIISNGDIILCKTINDQSFFNFGEIYLIITNEQRMVKFIKRTKKGQCVLLNSQNEDYDDITLPVEKIIKLYMVKGIIKRNQ
jgi:phage repressor protein C with HTH and peptisase S24 domain